MSALSQIRTDSTAARSAYEAEVVPAWAQYLAIKATFRLDSQENREVIRRLFERFCRSAWFPAESAFRQARSGAEQRFTAATGLQPWERFSGEPF